MSILLTKRCRRIVHAAPRISFLVSLAVWSSLGHSQVSQAGPSPAAAKLYDSIRVARSAGADGGGFRVRMNNDLEAVNTTLAEMIAFAYNVHPKRIINAPVWANTIAFDMSLHYSRGGVPDDAACKEMLKQALKDRFSLALHGGGEGVPSYAIHVEPAGAKLAKSLELQGTLPALAMPEPGMLKAHNASVADLASTLQRNVVDRPVVDESGVIGRWDFELKWVAAGGAGKPTATATNGDLAEAMKSELGLRLDAVTAPPSDVILDGVQMPAGI